MDAADCSDDDDVDVMGVAITYLEEDCRLLRAQKRVHVSLCKSTLNASLSCACCFWCTRNQVLLPGISTSPLDVKKLWCSYDRDPTIITYNSAFVALPLSRLLLLCTTTLGSAFAIVATSCRGELQEKCTGLKAQSQDLVQRLGEAQRLFEKERQGKQESDRALEVRFVALPSSYYVWWPRNNGVCHLSSGKANAPIGRNTEFFK